MIMRPLNFWSFLYWLLIIRRKRLFVIYGICRLGCLLFDFIFLSLVDLRHNNAFEVIRIFDSGIWEFFCRSIDTDSTIVKYFTQKRLYYRHILYLVQRSIKHVCTYYAFLADNTFVGDSKFIKQKIDSVDYCPDSGNKKKPEKSIPLIQVFNR